MRILILSDVNSVHTQKWVKGLIKRDLEICLFSLSYPKYDWHSNLQNFTLCHSAPQNANSTKLSTKLKYIFQIKSLKKCLKNFKPDIVHAHYATSYGLMGVLTGFKPFIISVWGADVYDFPQKGLFHRKLLKYILSKPIAVCSTSNSMAIQTSKYTNQKIYSIPFGLDSFTYQNFPPRTPIESKKKIIIGCIKMLTPKYGTDLLIKMFYELKQDRKDYDLKLLLVGGGSHENEYRALAEQFGLTDSVTFTGNVPHDEIPSYHRQIDIFVSLSILESESFGVSLIEAMASGSHVVASEVSGFREVLGTENQLGLLIEKKSIKAALSAVNKILNDPTDARIRSENALMSVKNRYEWQNNLDQMIVVYKSVLPK